jgi:hypothetical protein
MRSTCLRDATILIETCPGELREQFIDSVTMMFRQTRSGQWEQLIGSNEEPSPPSIRIMSARECAILEQYEWYCTEWGMTSEMAYYALSAWLGGVLPPLQLGKNIGAEPIYHEADHEKKAA